MLSALNPLETLPFLDIRLTSHPKHEGASLAEEG